MKSKEELYDMLSSEWEDGYAEKIRRFILEHGLIKEAMDIALERGHPQPFRAAFVLEWGFFKNTKMFTPYYDRILSDFNDIVSESVMRHYGKVIAKLVKKVRISDDQAGRIAETAVIRLINNDLKAGARIWSLDILYTLLLRVDWLREEMPGIIERLSDSPSPAMAARLRKYPMKSWMYKEKDVI